MYLPSYMSLYGAVIHTVRAGGVLTVNSLVFLIRNGLGGCGGGDKIEEQLGLTM